MLTLYNQLLTLCPSSNISILAIIYGFLGGKYFSKSFCATIILVKLSGCYVFLGIFLCNFYHRDHPKFSTIAELIIIIFYHRGAVTPLPFKYLLERFSSQGGAVWALESRR
jgi:hypothetical protein